MAVYPCRAHADMETEVEYLLHYIETSSCTFHRNGKVYDSKEAGSHIRNKYRHTKRWIKTTEDFIQYAATKSSVSGQLYQVTCNDMPLPTAQWLTDELAQYRGKGP